MPQASSRWRWPHLLDDLTELALHRGHRVGGGVEMLVRTQMVFFFFLWCCSARLRLAVIQSHTAPINQWLMEHFIMVDALEEASAKQITVVMPFYGYAHQTRTTAASRSRRAWSPTSSRPPVPTG